MHKGGIKIAMLSITQCKFSKKRNFYSCIYILYYQSYIHNHLKLIAPCDKTYNLSLNMGVRTASERYWCTCNGVAKLSDKICEKEMKQNITYLGLDYVIVQCFASIHATC